MPKQETGEQLAVNNRSLADKRSAALLLVMHSAGLCFSEAVAIDVEELALAERTLFLERSKTDQTGEGVMLRLTRPTVRSNWGPVQSGIVTGALFNPIYGHGNVEDRRAHQNTARNWIKAAAASIGLEGVSGHKLRRGMTTGLAESGASLPAIMQNRRWKAKTTAALFFRDTTRRFPAPTPL